MITKRVEKTWGNEEWIVNREYCGKILNLKKGYRSSMHYHKEKHETLYLLEGMVLFELNGEASVMFPGDSVTIEQLNKHRFTGLKDSKIIEFSTTHYEEDSYRETQSEKIDLTKIINEFNLKSKSPSGLLDVQDATTHLSVWFYESVLT